MASTNLAMAMSLVASTRGLALMPEYATNLSAVVAWSAGRWKADADRRSRDRL
ncbi:hypothetical protein ACFFYR_11955 [Paraburkholderia dipogonis]|uniref:hypothetical protein n=1 Tax=Paraburkholderia dipogonis TaxID=1211383 RepID=UPI0035E96F67